MPGFSWKRAIDKEVLRVHIKTLQQLREISVSHRDIAVILEHINNNRDRTILDPSHLEDEISKTYKLTSFVMGNYIEFQTKTVSDRAYGKLSFWHLQHFCCSCQIGTSTLLLVSFLRLPE